MHIGVSNRQELLKVFPCQEVLLLGRWLDGVDLGWLQVGNESSWITSPPLTGRNTSIRGNHRTWFKNSLRLNDTSFQNSALFTDNNEIVNSARLQDASSSNSYIVTNVTDWRKARFQSRLFRKSANNTAFTNRTAKTNSNWVRLICSDNSTIPDGRFVPVSYIPNDCRRGSNKGVVGNKGGDTVPRDEVSVTAENLSATTKKLMMMEREG